MSFGDFSFTGMPSGAIAPPNLFSPVLSRAMFDTPGLSSPLLNMEGQGENGRIAGDFEPVLRRHKEDEYESRSGSDNMEGGSADDQDADVPPRKKRYHRHTPQQIQELEALFKECPHPDEKQRLELSKRLCLESRQVKFWFQNRRTQMKTQLERHENSLLRQENNKLRAENMSMRDAMRNPVCCSCGGPAGMLLSSVSLEEQHLRMENAKLKDELERFYALAGKFVGRPVQSMDAPVLPQMPISSLELAVGSNNGNAFTDLGAVKTNFPDAGEFGAGLSEASGSKPDNVMGLERSIFLELALASMDEFVKMVQTNEPLWLPSLDGGKETLNYSEYLRTFPRCSGPKLDGFSTEATRESDVVMMTSLALVEALMDANRWAETFPSLIAKASLTDVISSGMGGTKSGIIQLMQAELQFPSPLVPVRNISFLRFCKQHAEGIWAVVDVSIDGVQERASASPYANCRRLPSGCLVQDLPNGYSKVTLVEHAEFEEREVDRRYRPLLRSGLCFGAHRWLAALKRQSPCIALRPTPMISHSPAAGDPNYVTTASGRRSMLKLAQRMTRSFCSGICPSTVHEWKRLSAAGEEEGVRVMTRRSADDPGEPPGVVLSAATCVRLPVAPRRLFDFLRDETLRSDWDILSNGVPMQEISRLSTAADEPATAVSLLRAAAVCEEETSSGENPMMLILQQTCSDDSVALVVYAPVDAPAMSHLMDGGDPACVALLPSGFAISPDAPPEGKCCGSLLTVAFQILVSHLPTAKLTDESVETVSSLISCTVHKIEGALLRQT